MNFFSTLNYCSCNEDRRTEAEALRIGPDDRVLCVTGSGDRLLNRLMTRPARVTAIDLDSAHNHLLRLKISAMRLLPYDEYVAFQGLASLAKSTAAAGCLTGRAFSTVGWPKRRASAAAIF